MRTCALLFSITALLLCQDNLGVLPEGAGLAARYAGDAGIAGDPAVVFVEDFGGGTLEGLRARWSDISNRDGRVLAFEHDVPGGSASPFSLRMTATRDVNNGGHLYRTFHPGYDRLFLRFYVKFARDAGFNHHFVSLGGAIDPPAYPIGGAGLRPVDYWSTGIEPVPATMHAGRTSYAPPGIWHFYTYWPEMHSWQTPEGRPTNDNGTAFYGNNFEPAEPVVVPRGEWICVEIMVRMNSVPDAWDGEQAMWLDGSLAGRFATGTMNGSWFKDNFDVNPAGAPFEGFRWRTNGRVNVNKLWLSHYASADQAFPRTSRYAAEHPEFEVNTREQTVWFAGVVSATEYIGPMGQPARAPIDRRGTGRRFR